ncbi:unnamed protein product [Clavelina lepadiformis]|uniref:Protein sleepless n=1 Tax=Clavelina lepadiformis TaxID=159417 RepID=A0ABP0FJ85_CLALP
MKTFIQVGILLALFVAQGSSIQCYQCQHISVTSGNTCYGPNIDDQYLQDCPEGQGHCSTTVANANVFGQAVVTVLRNCSAIYTNPMCPEVVSGIKSCVYFCSEDGCNNGNSGSLVQASLITLLLAMVGALALIKW